MPCKHFQSALTDAAASGAPTPELRQHLKSCSDCHAAFLAEQNLFASIDSTLHAQANADIPPALVSRLHARLAQEKPIVERSNWIPSWTFAAVSAAVIFLDFAFPVMKSKYHPPFSNSPVARLASDPPSCKIISDAHARTSANRIVSANASPFSKRAPRSGSIAGPSAACAALPPSELPEVIVPPAEREAFAQFVAAAQRSNSPDAATVSPAVKNEISIELLQIASVHVEALAPQMELTDFYGNTHAERH